MMLLMVASCQKLSTFSSMQTDDFPCSEKATTRERNHWVFRSFFRALNTNFFFKAQGLGVLAPKPCAIRLSGFLHVGNFRSNPRYTNSGDSFLKNCIESQIERATKVLDLEMKNRT